MEAAQETGNLIASEKVEGTNVYNTAGDTLGAIYDLMIDKATGKVAYALMSFGGFLGIGNQYHPLPWSLLKYDTKLGWLCRQSRQTAVGRRSRIRCRHRTSLGRSILRRQDTRLLRSRTLLGEVMYHAGQLGYFLPVLESEANESWAGWNGRRTQADLPPA